MGKATDHVRSVVDPDDAGPPATPAAADSGEQGETGTGDAGADTTAAPSPDQPQEETQIRVIPAAPVEIEQADDTAAQDRETR